MGSWKGEVIADSSGKWVSNGLRFSTSREAEIYVWDLSMRWTLVQDYRVAPSNDPVTHKIEDGRMVEVYGCSTEDDHVCEVTLRATSILFQRGLLGGRLHIREICLSL